MERFQGVVAKRLRLPASGGKSVSDTPGRAARCSTRRDHVGGRAIANSCILTRKQTNQRLVLAQGDARQTPNAAIGRAGYAKARARDRGVVGPRIVLERVKQPREFGEQSFVSVLKLAAPMKRVGQEVAFAIEIDASENRLGASLKGGEILGDPFGAT